MVDEVSWESRVGSIRSSYFACHDEVRAESAKPAEKTSKAAAAATVPATRASREQEGHTIPKTNSRSSGAACFRDPVTLLAPADGRRRREGARQPSRRSLRLCFLRARSSSPLTMKRPAQKRRPRAAG